MKDIIKLILKYHFTIVFILLEIIAFSLVIVHNNYQRSVFSGHIISVFSSISSIYTNVYDFCCLQTTNQELIAENIQLKNEIEELRAQYKQCNVDSLWKKTDSTMVDYLYYPAKIVNASFNKTKNYITLNKGTVDGLKVEMAVSSKDGVIGVIDKISRHYSKVIPLINTNLRVSAKIKKNGYYGSLQWNGDDYRYSYLNDIPFHVNVEIGDTIVTSGFSTIFPEGELIGFVESVNKETANFLSVKVKLATDFQKISDVYIIAHTKREEQQLLEKL